jgi:hypothetical protein
MAKRLWGLAEVAVAATALFCCALATIFAGGAPATSPATPGGPDAAAPGTRVIATASGPESGPYQLTVKIGLTVTRFTVSTAGTISAS